MNFGSERDNTSLFSACSRTKIAATISLILECRSPIFSDMTSSEVPNLYHFVGELSLSVRLHLRDDYPVVQNNS